MMNEGHVMLDIKGEEKKNLTIDILLNKFEEASGNQFASDKVLLS
jgi:putative ABC transport system ATP-binding protein